MKARKFRRIWGKPWDYSYLLEIEKRKFKEMAAYFSKSQLTVGWEFQVRNCELCVKLLDIILEKDQDYLSWLHHNYGVGARKQAFGKHINIKNATRFMHPSCNYEYATMRVELRRMKAWYLYHKIRLYYMQTLWD